MLARGVALALLLTVAGCKTNEVAPGVVDAAPAPSASASAPRAEVPSPFDAGVVALALATHATEDNERGVKVTVTRSALAVDDEAVSLEGFASSEKLLHLAFASEKSLSDLAFPPLVAAAKRRFADAALPEATVYADSSIPYLALGKVITSLRLAGVATLHLAVHAEGAGTKTFDFTARDAPPDEGAGVPVATVFTTFVRVQSPARKCEARPIRDPWEMKELAACAASVKRALGRDGSGDELVVVPGMAESTSTLVGILDALAPSFRRLALVVDGDILRGRAAKEELARMEREKNDKNEKKKP
jgi:hypothetical protein